ncbi:hypothetical protein BDW60DRAFT_197580 [Aspergillus nidulans var. acristatus]
MDEAEAGVASSLEVVAELEPGPIHPANNVVTHGHLPLSMNVCSGFSSVVLIAVVAVFSSSGQE